MEGRSETSSLLPKPLEAISAGSATDILAIGRSADGHDKNTATPTGDEEHQSNNGGKTVQYEGMPDVKAKLKYILPAIGIGVCIHPQYQSFAANLPRSFLLPLIKPLSLRAMVKLEAI